MCTVDQVQCKELSTRLSIAFSTIRNLEAEIHTMKRRWLETEGCLDDECKQRAKLEVHHTQLVLLSLSLSYFIVPSHSLSLWQSELGGMRSKIEEQQVQLLLAAQSEAKAAQAEAEYMSHVQLLNDSINEKVMEVEASQKALLSLKVNLLDSEASEQREIELRDRQIKALKLKEARRDDEVTTIPKRHRPHHLKKTRDF